MAQQKTNHTLPQETAHGLLISKPKKDVFRANVQALRSAGWTLASISTSTGLTRERIRQIANESSEADVSIDIPEPPQKVEPIRRAIHRPDPEVMKRLIELKPYAQAVRFNHSKGRVETEEYTKLIADEVARGVTIYQVAKALGVTRNAILFRLIRYGYMEAPEYIERYPHLALKVKYRALG